MTPEARHPGSASLGRYLREAFLFRWNLLFFLGGGGGGGADPVPGRAAAARAARPSSPISPDWSRCPDSAAPSTPRSTPPGARRSSPGPRPRCSRSWTASAPRPARASSAARALRGDARLAAGVRGARRPPARTTSARPASIGCSGSSCGSSSRRRRSIGSWRPGSEPALQRELDSLQARQAQAKQRGDERIVRSLAGQHRHRRAAARQPRQGRHERRVRGGRARSHRGQDPGARRDGGQPPGSGLPQQPGRLGRRQHAPDREGGAASCNQITGLADQLEEPPAILAATETEGR